MVFLSRSSVFAFADGCRIRMHSSAKILVEDFLTRVQIHNWGKSRPAGRWSIDGYASHSSLGANAKI